MQDSSSRSSAVIQTIIRKSSLKQDVYETTYKAFREIKKIIKEIVDENAEKINKADPRISFEFRDKTEFEVEIKFGGDVLIFLMHTNVFEFSRDHEVMKTSYIKDNIDRSYCGMITIFNFLSDSFKYNRFNDIGYMIGRVFINSENHYFIEGKKEVGQLYHNFVSSVLDESAIREIIESAMLYTTNFDLLTPPYESMKEVSVSEMQVTLENMPIKTGKRLGFRFYADTDEMK
ncbi:MAG: hypothetical protein AB9842_13440 [Bacteroidales bacterium]